MLIEMVYITFWMPVNTTNCELIVVAFKSDKSGFYYTITTCTFVFKVIEIVKF